MSDLLLPVGERRMSSWSAHQRRSPRSTEAGTDFYCPIGTPILAPADGRVYGSGNTITPATGRWIGLDLDNGMRFRAMHLSRLVTLPKSVERGQVIGYSGASGYGDEDWSWNPNTGGAHTHVTLWPTHASRYGYDSTGKPYTVDFMNYVGGTSGGGTIPGGFLMALTDQQQQEIYDVLSDLGVAIGSAGARNIPVGERTGRSVLANLVAVANGVSALRVGQANTNAYLYAGGPGVEATIGSPGSVFGRLVNATGGQATVNVDEAELAAQLAPLLSANLGALSDGDVERLAKAAADESDRRERERLGS